ncbi:bacteriochlorophyll 4-vinyl reductase [Niallia endozanthoxylica]|uniref:Bacteriochlorophyll 4-vinyl reductase n=1 Tax=Niallia endozanthoxylica TaxID=2036016 RepID=A0A5J5HJF8_9BACI|nr:bacteriochlorophyll 4-vinyl reductase [Niallia endozanthoxylica]KAA9019542.1 bacteriochlorophyll 4-vinyl reductase [Niallia endozanthoxylica]
MANKKGTSRAVELIVSNALKIPGVKVDRKEFLTQTFADKYDTETLNMVLTKGPIEAGISPEKINRVAKSLIEKRTFQSSSASFAAGLPGGFAMAATIPADTLQFFGVVLRLAQELAYLYGYKDIWEENELDMERVRGELILFLGVMFGVGGSAAALKMLTTKLSEKLFRKLTQRSLSKTISSAIIRKIAAQIGMKLSKDTFAKGISKVVPILGGAVSGSITYATMKKMGARLSSTLYESLEYTPQDYEKDLNEIKKEMPDIIDAEFTEVEEEILPSESK